MNITKELILNTLTKDKLNNRDEDYYNLMDIIVSQYKKEVNHREYYGDEDEEKLHNFDDKNKEICYVDEITFNFWTEQFEIIEYHGHKDIPERKSYSIKEILSIF